MTSGPDPRPEAVEAAVAWLRGQDPHLSLDALAYHLRGAGYGAQEVAAAIAIRQAELDAALPAGRDLRGRAATILLLTTLVVWGVISAGLLAGGPQEPRLPGIESLAAAILGGLLLVIVLLGLLIIYLSGGLKRGVEGAMVVALIVPLILVFVVAGLCVATTNGLNI